MRAWKLLVATVVALNVVAVSSPSACGGCFPPPLGVTLRQEAAQAKVILYGTLENPQEKAVTTDLRVIGIVKSDPSIHGKQVVTLPRFVPIPDAKDPPKYLVFLDVYQGKLDPYRGVPVKSAAVVDYLKGEETFDEKNQKAILSYAWRFLQHPAKEIADDAHNEFFRAFNYPNYPDARGIVDELSADKLALWLQNPNTPSNRLELYALLLGHCGTTRYAELLRKLMEDRSERARGSRSGVLIGYTLLQPESAWAYSLAILRNADSEFMDRFAVLRAIRFFWDVRPDIISKKDLLNGLSLLLDQSDMSDLVIEDLRKRGCWELTNRVLDLYDKKNFEIPIVRKAIIRFALSNSKHPIAVAWVKRLRQKEPELVQDVEELLKFETAPK